MQADTGGAGGRSGARDLGAYARAGDEALPAEGEPRPAYRGVVEVLVRLGAAELRRREERRDEEQRALGMTFGVPGTDSTRLFPVDLVPRMVDAADWAQLCAGLEQRARALDAFLHDVYGERAAVRDGILPAGLVDGAPGLRPTGTLLGRQRVRAHVAGMDVVRGADGAWRILEDNLRVPSGLAYAVQNRRLGALALPDLPRPAGLLDAEPAFGLLGDALRAAALPGAPDDPVVALLSEGPDGPAWFEHRMLADELGIPLVTAADVAVEDDALVVLDEGHRRRVDVLYLRIGEDELLDAAGLDGQPLGPPLLAAVRAGSVALANGLGNGVADDKAVYASVPALIRYYLGEEPRLASVPTYLCGDPAQLDVVLDRIGDLVLKPVDGYGGEGVLIGPLASDEEIEATRREVVAAPHRWIAQEVVELTTHPSFDGERLAPRHVDLRAFVLLSDRPRVAPAALTRVAPEGSMVVNSSRGGGSKDTWLVGAA